MDSNDARFRRKELKTLFDEKEKEKKKSHHRPENKTKI